MYWYDGAFCAGERLELTVTEPGLLYGATTFTTLRVYEQTLHDPRSDWPAHRRRLEEAVAEFDWLSPNWHRLETGAQQMAQRFPVLRLTLFADGRELITGRGLPGDLQQRQDEGVVAWLAEGSGWSRSLPHRKTGNYLAPWLALQQARKLGAVEAILANERGEWLETSTGTLWGWREGQWWTPPLSAGILPGVARARILQSASRQGVRIGLIPWLASQVREFEVLAYSNAVVGVVPIRRVLRSHQGRETILLQSLEGQRYDGGQTAMAELRSLQRSR
ncbi:MAG: aminotransferase class IV [Phormidium sp.]